MENKYDVNHYLIMYLTGYAFYFYQVYSQLLYSQYGLELIIPLIISFSLMPLMIYYVCRKINHHFFLKAKLKFIFTLISITYLIIISLITLNYASVMIHNYYYQEVKSYIIAIFLLIPTLYILFKNSKIYYSLAIILFTIFILFKISYISNQEVFDLYPLTNIFKINHPFTIILLSLPLFIEPIILLTNTNFINENKPINTKLIVIISLIISLIGIYTIVREVMEFGLLLETISFPYFESCKYMSIKSNFDNIDYYYLFSITIAMFSRIPLVYFNLKDHFKLKTKGILIMLLITIILFYYLQKRLEFYLSILNPLLIIASSLLIILLIISIFTKRRISNATN